MCTVEYTPEAFEEILAQRTADDAGQQSREAPSCLTLVRYHVLVLLPLKTQWIVGNVVCSLAS